MKGKKIIYNKDYLDNHFHGSYSKNAQEAERIKNNIKSETIINSNFNNPYNRIALGAKKVKIIK
jgi:hypothetical protein